MLLNIITNKTIDSQAQRDTHRFLVTHFPMFLWFVSDVIDLTGDDKDDLQRAIALSLEESNRAFRETGITDEEQAISRWGFNCRFQYKMNRTTSRVLSELFYTVCDRTEVMFGVFVLQSPGGQHRWEQG